MMMMMMEESCVTGDGTERKTKACEQWYSPERVIPGRRLVSIFDALSIRMRIAHSTHERPVLTPAGW